MTFVAPQSLTLEEFHRLPDLEESPAWEYGYGEATQKPMPKFRHSLLQKRLLSTLDTLSASYLAVPELRCTFGGRSLVLDIVVVAVEKIPLNAFGEPEDNFMQAPDWAIEILSPGQNSTRVIDNLLHCLKHGSQLGWLLDPNDYSVLVFSPQCEVELYRGQQKLPVLSTVELTAAEIFSWLKLHKN